MLQETQETHCTPNLEATFKIQFGSNDILFSNGDSNSPGVLTAISKGYDVKVIDVSKDTDGRYLIIDIERNGFLYRIGMAIVLLLPFLYSCSLI